MDNINIRTNKINNLINNLKINKMSKVKTNDTKVLKSKRFVVRLSLVGKNQLIEFTNKKGKTYTYNHDKVYSIMKENLESLDCFKKYKSYTASNNIPKVLRDKELV
jgi:gamma-glutamylcyclotransferase (GGCT)/AIG2-like uncharacterized protein YtfP